MAHGCNSDMVPGQGRYGDPGNAARTRRQCLADVLLLLALLCALPRAMAANAVDIAAVVGFTDTFRPGHWTPLTSP